MNRTAKTLLLFLQLVLSLAVLLFCANGVYSAPTYDNEVIFISCAVRIICGLVFALFYYRSLSSFFGTETLFIPLYLVFMVCAEIRVFDYFARAFQFYIISPTDCVNIFMFSALMSVLCFIGYCLFRNKTSSANITIFIIAISIMSIIMTFMLPKSQNFQSLNDFFVFNVAVRALYVAAALSCLLLYLTTPRDGASPLGFSLRYIALFLLLVNSYINMFYNSVLMDFIGTAFSLAASVLMLIITRRDAIRF